MGSAPGVRRRFWFEGITALIAGSLALLTVIRPDWIELAFRIDPDAGSGSLEWLIVVIATAIALATSAGAIFEWRRFRRLAAAP
jgi:hypothetical protein